MIRPSVPLLVALLLSACSDYVSPRAERVFYRGDDMAAWGTVCRLNQRGFLGIGRRGYVSAAHVTENGTPVVGPKDAVTVSDARSDWSFLGIDPADLDAQDYPAPKQGARVEIHGFPARDRDGEVIPGTLYMDDPQPPFWWVELRDSDDGIAAEGVIGGISGSCVLDGEGRLIAVVHANGFSRIEGTTNTWAKVISVRDAILEAQGRGGGAGIAAATAAAPPPPLPPAQAAQPRYAEVEPVFLAAPPLAAAPPAQYGSAPASAVVGAPSRRGLASPVRRIAPASARADARLIVPKARGAWRPTPDPVCRSCL